MGESKIDRVPSFRNMGASMSGRTPVFERGASYLNQPEDENTSAEGIDAERYQALGPMLEDVNRGRGGVEKLMDYATRFQANILTDAAILTLLTPNAFELRSFLDFYRALRNHLTHKEVTKMVGGIPKETRTRIIFTALTDSDAEDQRILDESKVNSTVGGSREDTRKIMSRSRSVSDVRPYTFAISRATSDTEDNHSRSGKRDPSAFGEVTEMFGEKDTVAAIRSGRFTDKRLQEMLLLLARGAIVEEKVESLGIIMNILHKMIPENEVEDFWNTLVPTDESQEKKQFPRYRLLWEAMRSGNWEVCNLVSRYHTKTMESSSVEDCMDDLLLAARESDAETMMNLVESKLGKKMESSSVEDYMDALLLAAREGDAKTMLQFDTGELGDQMVSSSVEDYPDALLLAAREGKTKSMIKFVESKLGKKVKWRLTLL